MSRSVGWRATDGSSDYQDFIRTLQSAVRDEITAQTERSREQTYRLKEGKYLSRSLNYSTYRFLSYPDMQLDEDASVLAEIDGKKIDGYIVACSEDYIDIALKDDFGATIKEAEVTSNTAVFFEELGKRLEDIAAGKAQYNAEGCMKLFGFVEPNTTGNRLIHGPKIKGLNEDQTVAVHKAVSQEVTFIWGPPGTGKTHTISTITKRLIQQNKSVLLISRTNDSIDEALKEFAVDFENKSVIDKGKVIRHGIVGNHVPLLNNFIVESIQINKYWKVHDVIDRHMGEIQAHEAKISHYRAIIESEPYKEISRVEEALFNIDSLIKHIRVELASTQVKVSELDKEIGRLEKAGASPRVAITRRLNKMINGEGDTFLNALKMDRDNLIEIEKNRFVLLDELSTQILDLKQKANDAKNRIFVDQGINDITTIRRLPELIEALKAKIELERVSIDKSNQELAHFNDHILKDAQLVGCTIGRCYTDPAIYGRRFDTLIIDDSSLVSLPEIFFIAGLASQYIISGDFRLLPPRMKSTGEFAARWLKRDIFDQAGIIDSMQQGIEDTRIVMLREQYTLHPDIIDLVNKSLYAGQITSTVARERPAAIASRPPFDDQAVVMCDTSRINPWCSRKINGSRFNPYSALLAIGLAEAALGGGQKEVVIVTSQKAQAQVIDGLLKRREIPESAVYVTTFQQFHGRAKECMIVDLVDGPPYDVSVLLSQSEIGSLASRLINAVVTRAIGKLIIIANRQYTKEKLTPGSLAYEIIAHLEAGGTIYDSANMITSYQEIISDEADDETGHDDNLVMFSEAEFFLTIARDIKKARSRIVIFSPFMSRERMGTLLPGLKAAAERGVSVYLVTRAPETYATPADGLPALIDEVRATGIKVIVGCEAVGLSDVFHEKIALIDDYILYIGGLNILSNDAVPGPMLEISSEDIIEDLIKNYRIDSVISKYERTVSQAKKGSKP